MEQVSQALVKKIYLPPKNSHKGQNGKLTIIGGSKLFHGASLWALKTASRIVDMVFYATVQENTELTKELNAKLYDFICVPLPKVAEYIEQSDAVLIGPGMVRGDENYTGTGESGLQTKKLTGELLTKFPQKKWIIDAGALQTMEPEWLKKLKHVIITPHKKEFLNLFYRDSLRSTDSKSFSSNGALVKAQSINKVKGETLLTKKNILEQSPRELVEAVHQKAKEYNCVIVFKGKTDIICSPDKYLLNSTGNEGMTKGGTGDVLAGLIAALACKNDTFVAAAVGAYINGLAGDALYKKVGPYFNASDLCDQIPKTLWEIIKK